MADGEQHIDQGRLYAYRPALDGLRAVAVLAVMLYHGAQLTSDPIDALPGGFLGVDLFFVLSGYLITTLLVSEFDATATIRFAQFWLRRARRLLPALVAMVTAITIVFLLREAVELSATQIANYRGDALSTLFYVANWRFTFSGQTYFDQFSGPSPFRHMWSLAIEEQFYLIWPCLLYLLLKLLRVNRNVMLAITIVGALASAAAMALLFDAENPSRVYYGTDTRVQAMLVGAAFAFALAGRPRSLLGHPIVQGLGVAGLVGCVAFFRFAGDDPLQYGWMYRGGFLVLALLAALAITAAAGPDETPYARALAWRPLVWIGTISYGLYLWHWPVYVVVDTAFSGLGGPTLLALRFALTFAIAVVSYRYIEAPIRFGTWRRSLPQRRIAYGSCAACLALIAVGMVAVSPPEENLAAAAAAQTEAETNKLWGDPVKPGDLKVLLAGDSVAISLSYKVQKTDRFDVRVASTVGCGVVRGSIVLTDDAPSRPRPQCEEWPQTWKRAVNMFKPDVVVLIVGAWEVFDHEVNGQVLRVGTPEYEAHLLAELQTALDVLTARGAKLVIATVPCMKVLKPGTESDFPQREDDERRAWVNGVLRKFSFSRPNKTSIVDLDAYLCPEGVYVDEIEGERRSDDGTHFVPGSATKVIAWLLPQLERFRK